MKTTLTKIALVIMGAGLVSCSTNTQTENTTLGAVAGAVVGGLAGSAIGAGTGRVVAIGVGAIAGALIGGAIGNSMDSSDNVRTSQALNSGQTTTWVNNRTGNTYTFVPGKTVTVNGNPNCRRYYTTAIINGEKRYVYGVACPASDGTWRMVSSR